MPALVFAGVSARAPLTLNVGRLSNGNAIGQSGVGRLQPDTPCGARP